MGNRAGQKRGRLRPDPPDRFEPAWSVTAWEWQIPLALLVVGLIALLIGASLVGGPRGTAGALLDIVVYLVIYVPLTIAAMYLTAYIFGLAFGFLKTAVIKLAAISVFTEAVDKLGDWLGHPFVGWIAAVLVTYYLFSYCFDLDFRETVLAVIVISIIRFCLGIGIFLLLANLIGGG